jgi:hypothetical protein
VARSREILIPFPTGGLDRSGPYDEQPTSPRPTTPGVLNCWPLEPASDRWRGGVRPVLQALSTSTISGAPYAWSRVDYLDSGAKRGILVTTATGTYSTLNGTAWVERIATNPTSDFATCTYMLGKVYQATSGANCIEAAIPSGSDANLSNAGGGTAPTNCGLVWTHQGRLALSGKSDGAHQVFMSATGDATNWDYTVQSSGGAWANTGADAGKIGEMVTAAINHNRDVSLVGSPRSMYAIVGNPKVPGNGTKIVSQSIGPLMQNAWCKGIDANGGNSTFILSYDGLYYLPDGSLSEPIPISRRKIPNDLIGIDPAVGDKCCIGYDSRWPGIHVSVDFNTGADQHWYYHLATESWWPMELPATIHLYPTFPAMQTDAKSAILPVASNGQVYQYNNGESQGGANENFDSYVLIFVPLSSNGTEGILHAISATLAAGSENVNVDIFAGDSFEEAYDKAILNSSPDFTLAQWTQASGQYFNYWQHPRVRGGAVVLRIEDVSNEKWLIEKIVARIVPGVSIRRVG